MKILIVEDDEFKRRWLSEAVSECTPKATILHAKSVNAGLAVLTSDTPDILLLDMSLTTFDVGPEESGGRPQNFGGLEILRQMDRLELKVPTVVITQHLKFDSGSREMQIDALYEELRNEFGDTFEGLIYYNSSQGDWKPTLTRLIKHIAKEKKDRDRHTRPRR